MLQFKQVKKYYQRLLVLDIPDFTLEPGIFWVQGQNGSGKTTLLKILGGLAPFSGHIWLDDIEPRKDPVAYRRLVSWSEAEPLYPGFLTGEDILKLYIHVRKTSAAETEPLLHLFQVKPFLSLPLGSYSSGMTKKLSLLLAFIGYPRLILLDEPLVTLDKDTVDRVYDLIRAAHEEKGCSFLMTSHQDFREEILPIHKKLSVDHHTLRWIS